MKNENAAIAPKAGIYEIIVNHFSALKTSLQAFLMPGAADTLMIDPLTGEILSTDTEDSAEKKDQIEPYYYLYMHWYV